MKLLLSSLISCIIILSPLFSQSVDTSENELRPMTFLDMRKMKRTGSYAPSPDSNWMLYTMTLISWKSEEDQTD